MHMQETRNRAELAAALGVSEAKITAMTVTPTRSIMKPVPVYEPSSFILERAIEVSQVGDQHVVFNRTRIWADRRQIHSSAKTIVICQTADDAHQRAERLRSTAELPQ